MRPPRNTDPDKIRLITIRTLGAELLLRPDDELNEIVGGVIAKYQEEFDIRLFAHKVLANHYHLLAQAPKQNLWRFCQAVNRELAKRVNKHLGRSGPLWSRRYDEQITVEQADALEALIYIICNATNHGLVSNPKDWPGISSYRQMLDGKDRKYQFTNYSAYGKAKILATARGETVSLNDYKSTHTLSISPLPQFEDMSLEERNAIIVPLIEKRVSEIHKERKSKGQWFLGRKGVLKQDPNSYPRTIQNSPRPLCYTKCAKAREVFKKWFTPWCQWYKEASRKLRSGEWSVDFPPNCLKPPLHYALSVP